VNSDTTSTTKFGSNIPSSKSTDSLLRLRSMEKDRRVNLSQAQVSCERVETLKPTRLIIWAIGAIIAGACCVTAVRAQQKLWSKQDIVALAGPEASFIVPLLVSCGYLSFVFAGTRRMQGRPSSSRWYELMIIYNVSITLCHAVVAVGVASESWVHRFSVIGNPAPRVGGPAHYRLGALVVMHYYTTIFELLDTFFLIARKKLGSSLVLHVMLRVDNVWTWYLACRFCCGGDVYFPVFVGATASALLHLRYTLNLLHIKQAGVVRFVSQVQVEKS